MVYNNLEEVVKELNTVGILQHVTGMQVEFLSNKAVPKALKAAGFATGLAFIGVAAGAWSVLQVRKLRREMRKEKETNQKYFDYSTGKWRDR